MFLEEYELAKNIASDTAKMLNKKYLSNPGIIYSKEKDIKTDADLAAHEYIFESFSNTGIPIISEEEAREMNPDYFFVLPWHFKEFILNKEKFNKNKKIPLLFPLPSIEII